MNLSRQTKRHILDFFGAVMQMENGWRMSDNDNQHGFRVERSTESAGLTLARLIEQGNQGRFLRSALFLI